MRFNNYVLNYKITFLHDFILFHWFLVQDKIITGAYIYMI